LALGTLGLSLSRSLPLALTFGVLAGLGHGAADVSFNVLIAEVFAARSASALNLLNVFFGVGAVAGPAAAGLALRLWGTALPALWLGVALLLLQAPLVPLLAVPPRARQHHAQASRGAPVLASPLLWALGLLMLIYVGTETGIGGWTTTYLERTTAIGTAAAALMTSGFWLALTGGRVVGALLGARVAPNTLLTLSLAGSLAGGALLAASTGNVALTTAAVLLTGLCFGPIFPTTFSIVTSTFRQAPGTAASVAVALGSVGGMLLPVLQGALLERSGPASSVLLVALGTLAMLGLHLGRGLLDRSQTSVVSNQKASIDY
ncbi:MAG TPA: MFS transporter, partial [Roseiflexaceae bacterium]